jgi:hypothetical protein
MILSPIRKNHDARFCLTQDHDFSHNDNDTNVKTRDLATLNRGINCTIHTKILRYYMGKVEKPSFVHYS